MTKWRCALYRMLTVLVALYGVMSACICTDHVSSQAAMPACHHCVPQNTDVAGAQLASHHQCCGMERAPIAIEKVTSPSPVLSDVYVVLRSASLFSDVTADAVAVSTSSHAPPGDIPIYFTTQRFLI